MAFRVGQIKQEFYKQQGFETIVFVDQSEFNSTNYDDITSPHVLANQAIRERDYDFVRQAMIYDVEVARSGFSNLDEIDKPFAAEYNATYSASTIQEYYQTELGLGTTGGTAEYLYAKSKMYDNRKDSYSARLQSREFRSILVKYLSLSDIEIITLNQKNLFDKYEDEVVLGKSYGDTETGIMDWITATNDYQNLGLSSYTTNIGTWEDLRDELIDLLVNGDYIPENNDEE
jgi:hypothetical protein